MCVGGGGGGGGVPPKSVFRFMQYGNLSDEYFAG